jgi:hypothetical protein
MGFGASPEVIPKPLGKISRLGATNTDDSVAVEITVTKGKTFHLAKVVLSSDKDCKAYIRWNEERISVIYHLSANIPFTDWFPWDWNPCLGDGSKKIDVYTPNVGTAGGTLYAELSGEEV